LPINYSNLKGKWVEILAISKKKVTRKVRKNAADSTDFPAGSRSQWKLLGDIIRNRES
jgi:hypothetical protein